jgi:hypothetical protein
LNWYETPEWHRTVKLDQMAELPEATAPTLPDSSAGAQLESKARRGPSHPAILRWLAGAAVVACVIFAPGQSVLAAFWRALLGPKAQPGIFGIALPAVVTGVILVANLIAAVGQSWSLRRWGWVSSLLLPLPLMLLGIGAGQGSLSEGLIAVGKGLATASGLVWACIAGGAITIVALIAFAFVGPHPPEPPRWPGEKG